MGRNKGDAMRRVYLSGAITGIANYAINFAKAEKDLKERGYEVVNPVKVGELLEIPEAMSEENKYSAYMRADIKALMDCTHIYMLDGFSKLRGANAELDVAIACGIVVIYQGDE